MEMNMPLRCYEDPEISWLNPQFGQCDLSTGIAGQERGAYASVDPTVQYAGGAFTIRDHKGGVFEILDMSGRTVSLIEVKNGTGQFVLNHRGQYVVRPASGATRPVRIVVN
jgi:hypothetical protein